MRFWLTWLVLFVFVSLGRKIIDQTDSLCTSLIKNVCSIEWLQGFTESFLNWCPIVLNHWNNKCFSSNNIATESNKNGRCRGPRLENHFKIKLYFLSLCSALANARIRTSNDFHSISRRISISCLLSWCRWCVLRREHWNEYEVNGRVWRYMVKRVIPSRGYDSYRRNDEARGCQVHLYFILIWFSLSAIPCLNRCILGKKWLEVEILRVDFIFGRKIKTVHQKQNSEIQHLSIILLCRLADLW